MPSEIEDDEPEVEVIHTPPPGPRLSAVQAVGTSPPPARRNPRQRRNVDDDVIESGEIPERRSLVVRSNHNMEAFSDEPTDINVSAIPIPPGTPWRRLWLLGAVLAAAGALAIQFVPTATGGAPATGELATTATMIGTMLDTARGAMLGRAEVIASSSMVRAAIETDAATLADMAKDRDVMFPREPNQILEVVQIAKGQRTSLLRLPPEATSIDAPPAGDTALALRDGVLGAAASAAIPEQRSGISGEIVTWRPIELAPIIKRLGDQTGRAVLEGLATPVELVTGAPAANVRLAITTKLVTAKPLALAAFLPPPAAGPNLSLVRTACAGAALAMLLLYLAFVIRARRALA